MVTRVAMERHKRFMSAHLPSANKRLVAMIHLSAISSLLLRICIERQGRYAEAEPLYRRALAIHELAFGPAHPSSRSSRDNLALLLCAQGRLAEAEPLFKRSLASQGSLDVALCLHHLADLHSAQGRYAAAKPLYRSEERRVGKERRDRWTE